MAKPDSKRIRERAREINDGWKQDATAKTVKFMNIAQADFEADIADCEAEDAAIAEDEAKLRDRKDRRDDKYKNLNSLSVKVRNGVEGNADYGDDSPLYGAMGFKRKSERASGLTRRKISP